MKLIVIDIQKGITDERLYDYDDFIRNVKNVIDSARENGVEIIYVQHDDGPESGFSIGDVDYEIADQVCTKTQWLSRFRGDRLTSYHFFKSI